MKCLVVLLITWGLAMSFPFENGKESQDKVPSSPPPKMVATGPRLVNAFNNWKNPGGNQGGNGGNFNIKGNQKIGGHHNVGQQGNFGPGGNQGGNGGNFNSQIIAGDGNVGQQGHFGQGGNQGGGCQDVVSSCSVLAKRGLCVSLQSVCCQSCMNPPVMPTVPGNNNIGQTKKNAAKSCKEIKGKRPNAGPGVYWIKPDGINPIQVYCDQQTDGGGWTLVFSYTFTNYGAFRSHRNAITPRPNWPIHYDSGNINPSTTPPQSETDYNAMDFNLWKNLGHEFMVKSNINHWIACKEGSGSLVEFRVGSLQCRLIKNVASKCQNYVPDELILHAAGNPHGKTLGPDLIRSQSRAWVKEYYHFEANTRTINWPTHDPCGKHSPNHLKNVANPHGNIYIRE